VSFLPSKEIPAPKIIASSITSLDMPSSVGRTDSSTVRQKGSQRAALPQWYGGKSGTVSGFLSYSLRCPFHVQQTMLELRPVVVALLLPVVACAQAVGTPPIKVTTRLIQVSVLVHDDQGNPISDLKKDDFEVTDNGKSQSIGLFKVETLNPANGPVAKAQPIIPRNVVTNRPERQAGVPAVVSVLLLDLYNTEITDQMYSRRHVVKFLQQIRPEDRIAFYVLNGTGLRIVHDFTNNSETLLAALQKISPGFSHELDSSTPDPANTRNDDLDKFLDLANTTMSNFYTRNRVINTCVAFKTLADHLTGVQGRKNLIWLSGGFPIQFGFGDPQAASTGFSSQDRELFASYIEAASEAMNTANIAIYPVDARGLLVNPLFGDASKNVKIDRSNRDIPQQLWVDRRNNDSMNYIADLTGGEAFYNTNDIGGAIRRAVEDSRVTYTLGYYLPDERQDNKFHKIKVKVDRSGVTVRTKKGYFAHEQMVPNAAKLDEVLRQAIWSPLDSANIGVSARIDPSTILPNASRPVFMGGPL
jgi:VWFA-related protein